MISFARLAQQAEGNLAELSRRAIDSITLPIKIRSQELIGEATRTVAATVKSLLIKAGLGLFAVVMALVAIIYALGALDTVLAEHFGPVEAGLLMAGLFLLLAIVGVVGVVAWPKPSTALPSAAEARRDASAVIARAREQARIAETRADDVRPAAGTQGAADEPLDLGAGLGAIAAALGEAGYKREQAGLRAGIALAEQLRPMQLVSLALIGGFVAGVRLTRRR